MGQRDYCLKRYLSDETRFADLINGILGEGQQLISPFDLADMDSQVGYRVPGWASKDTFGRLKYRDLLKKVACGVNFVVIGVEHQEQPNYLMPLRCMGYDVREYERQAAVEKSRLRQWKKMTKLAYRNWWKKRKHINFWRKMPMTSFHVTPIFLTIEI